MGPSPGTEPGNKTRGPMEPGIGTGFGKRPESVPTEPGTGPGANRSPYPPDESPRADAGPSVRNPHAASLTPASAGVFRNESRPNAPQTSQKPSHPPRRRKIAPPSDPGKTHPTPGKPVRAPGSPCPPGIADPFSRTRPPAPARETEARTAPRQPFRTLDTALRNPPASPAPGNRLTPHPHATPLRHPSNRSVPLATAPHLRRRTAPLRGTSPPPQHPRAATPSRATFSVHEKEP